MALPHSTIEHIQMLSHSANALEGVTNSGDAVAAILHQIKNLAAGDRPAAPKRACIKDRIETAKVNSIRGLYGLFAELAKDQSTTIGELTTVAQELGYKNVGVITI